MQKRSDTKEQVRRTQGSLWAVCMRDAVQSWSLPAGLCGASYRGLRVVRLVAGGQQ